jgi:hypothetical protein
MMTKKVDSDGNGPMWRPGDRVWVAPLKMEATVIQQLLSYDGPDYCFWGNVELQYDDGTKGISNNWQIMRVNK